MSCFLFLRNRRSQVSMEFLVTYGWAILVVLAAIAALAYFGVLNPAKFFPESCTLSPTSGMACLDFNVFPGSAHLLIMNSGGRDVSINNITIGGCSADFNIPFPDGSSRVFNITGCSFGTEGEKIKKDIVVYYTDTFSAFTKSCSGSISATVAVS